MSNMSVEMVPVSLQGILKEGYMLAFFKVVPVGFLVLNI